MMTMTVVASAAGRAGAPSCLRRARTVQPIYASIANVAPPVLAPTPDDISSRGYHVRTWSDKRRGGDILGGRTHLLRRIVGLQRQQRRHLALSKRMRLLRSLQKTADERPIPNWTPDPELDAQLLDEDPLFPPPTDDSVRRRGLPLLVRAAHHAREGRTLCYDLYHQNQPDQRKGDDAEGEEGAGGRSRKVRHTYADVLERSTTIHHFLLKKIRSDKRDRDAEEKSDRKRRRKDKYEAGADAGDIDDAEEEEPPPPRVAFLCHPGSDYVAVQWASWSSGAIAVPLCAMHKSPELRYVLEDADPLVVVDGTALQTGSDEDGAELRRAASDCGLADRIVDLRDVLGDNAWGEEELLRQMEGRKPVCQLGRRRVKSLDRPAMILYTSGTTGPPKGVVSTHRNLYHQVTDLVTSWRWTADDSILHMLPLHHVHGIVNKLCCAVWAGASVEFVRFHPRRAWERLAEKPDFKGAEEHPEKFRRPLTLFMAVPTVYAKMLEAVPALPTQTIIDAKKNSLEKTVRLTVSGSAALPTSIFRRWKDLTGQTILERYGMTEFGMALSNPLEPVEGRVPGYVGLPLPSVDVKIVDEDTGEDIPNASADDVPPGGGGGVDGAHPILPDRSGELLVRGLHVFSHYWNKPDATDEAFDDDEEYFRTGDVAEYDPLRDSYHILGRVSADIIKCGGHKLSSLQIERVLLEHPRLAEAVVMGVPDEAYGERVGLICRMKEGPLGEGAEEEFEQPLTLGELKEWCADRMAPYKVPTRLRVVGDVPKNAMGKVSKKQLLHLFEDEK